MMASRLGRVTDLIPSKLLMSLSLGPLGWAAGWAVDWAVDWAADWTAGCLPGEESDWFREGTEASDTAAHVTAAIATQRSSPRTQVVQVMAGLYIVELAQSSVEQQMSARIRPKSEQ